MSRTRTSSRWFSSKVLSSTESGSAYSPARISPYARATRAGVSRRPVAVGVFPDRDEQLADRGLGPRLVQLRDRAPVGQGDRVDAPGYLAVAVARSRGAQLRPPSSTGGRVPAGGVSVVSPASGARPLPGHGCAGVGTGGAQPGGGHDCPDGVVAGRQSGGAP